MAVMSKLCTLFLIMNVYGSCVHAMIENLYCGAENCYDILGVTRDSVKNEIARAYRELARKHHPDRHKTAAAKSLAEEKFRKIATAYEILKDDESRNNYNYMLDHPEEVYSHYYRYYRHRMAPKVDARIVVAVTISIISVVQYFTAWQRYESAIKYLIASPKYRLKAMDIAKKEGLLNTSKKKGRRSKEELKEEEDGIIRKVLEENMDIRGGYAKPQIKDILWIQLIILPYTIVKYSSWYTRWLWKFSIKGEAYGKEEQLYLIRKFMGMSQMQFDALEEVEREGYLDDELWKKENFQVWREEKEEEMKRQLAEKARYKSYRRYMKNRGPGRMYFDDS